MASSDTLPTPTLLPLGDSALLVRFDTRLSNEANRAAIALAVMLDSEPIPGVVEIMPNLVSVMLRYDPMLASSATILGDLRLRLFGLAEADSEPRHWTIPVSFDGPDLVQSAEALGLTVEAFIDAHNAKPLRVLATGFAPGFVYCGLHDSLTLPRRSEVRPSVPAGSVLFAAGQTAITATDMPTGWHVIGRTAFSNFDPASHPPTQLGAGDIITFVTG